MYVLSVGLPKSQITNSMLWRHLNPTIWSFQLTIGQSRITQSGPVSTSNTAYPTCTNLLSSLNPPTQYVPHCRNFVSFSQTHASSHTFTFITVCMETEFHFLLNGDKELTNTTPTVSASHDATSTSPMHLLVIKSTRTAGLATGQYALKNQPKSGF